MHDFGNVDCTYDCKAMIAIMATKVIMVILMVLMMVTVMVMMRARSGLW